MKQSRAIANCSGSIYAKLGGWGTEEPTEQQQYNPALSAPLLTKFDNIIIILSQNIRRAGNDIAIKKPFHST